MNAPQQDAAESAKTEAPDETAAGKALQIEAIGRLIDRLPNKVRMQVRSHERNGQIGRPRAALEVGEEVRTESHTYWVARVKADGRLRLTWSGGHHGVGAVIRIKDVRYLVTGVGPIQIMLRLSTAEECARMDGPWAAPNADGSLVGPGVYVSEEITLGEIPPMPKIEIVYRTHELTPAQMARRDRKATRARGEMERRLKRAAERAPAGSIGAAMAGGVK